jgi:predicted transcriptional regulator
MAASTTMTIRVTAETRERLGELARVTRRSRSFLAAEAVAAYLDREQAIIEGIGRGRADVAAGRVVSNEGAMAELEAAIDAAGAEGGAEGGR